MFWNTNNNSRQMPWKGEKDAYKIWLSEIILQQTRVDQGWAYYEKFITHYPTIKHLAKASDDDVFKLWEGLGYYSRCKNLLDTARVIAEKYHGNFPDTYEKIIALKGIGPYTAAAIGSFAFGLPHAVVDGNVYRVLARYFGIHAPTDSAEGKKHFTILAGDCLDKVQPGIYNQSIMDFGATVCTPSNPLCNTCVLHKKCIAFKENIVEILPIKTKKLIKRSRWFTYFIIENEGNILVRKRTEKDIWQNLHEFYLEESGSLKSWDNLIVNAFFKSKLSLPTEVIGISEIFSQKLTHQTIFARFIQVKTKMPFVPPVDYFFQPKTLLRQLAFPKTITEYLEHSAVQSVLFR